MANEPDADTYDDVEDIPVVKELRAEVLRLRLENDAGRDLLKRTLEAVADPKHTQLLDTLENLFRAGRPPVLESCSHLGEPRTCANCAVDREHRKDAARVQALEVLRQVGRGGE